MNPLEFIKKNPKMKYILIGMFFIVVLGLSYTGLKEKKAAEAPAAAEAPEVPAAK